jgi:flagellar basal-body rod protein FlgB
MAGLKLFSFTQQLLELSMRGRAARHEVLSANIANADTPGYRPRDVDFSSIIRSAVETEGLSAEERDQRMEQLSNSPLDLESVIYQPEFPDDRAGEDRLDGNSVSLDRQVGLLTENSLAYEANLTLLSRTLAQLRYAISEGKSQ